MLMIILCLIVIELLSMLNKEVKDYWNVLPTNMCLRQRSLSASM